MSLLLAPSLLTLGVVLLFFFCSGSGTGSLLHAVVLVLLVLDVETCFIAFALVIDDQWMDWIGIADVYD